MKRVFRPFWSVDIQKTEKWLSDMNLNGFALKSMNPLLKMFNFKRSQPEQVYYRIGYSKNTHGMPAELLSESEYTEVCHTNDFFVAKTSEEKPKTKLSYHCIFLRNRRLVDLYLLISLCFTLLGISFLTFDVILYFNSNSVRQFLHPALLFPLFIATVYFFLFVFYPGACCFKLKKSQKQLKELCGILPSSFSPLSSGTRQDKKLTKELLKSGKMIRRWKLGWFYSPDKTEEWLRKMEEQGCNLVHLSKPGILFYFYKGEPRKLTYQIDFPKFTDTRYFQKSIDNGWLYYYFSNQNFFNLVIWGKENTENSPRFYGSDGERLAIVKTFLKYTVLPNLGISCLYLFILIFEMFLFLSKGNPPLEFILLIILFLFNSVLFTSIWVRGLLYYFRVKKSLKCGNSE